jgi:secondary thiamine-phosphate synthase enzyme
MIVLREYETKTGGRFDVIDLTDEVSEVVHSSGVGDGTVLIFSPHTTCSVLIGSPGPALISSLERAMDEIAPADAYYAHDDFDIRTENLQDNEPANAPSHIFHIIAGRVSESVPVENGKVLLGNGQRILFIELDGSRLRRYCIQVVGE